MLGSIKISWILENNYQVLTDHLTRGEGSYIQSSESCQH